MSPGLVATLRRISLSALGALEPYDLGRMNDELRVGTNLRESKQSHARSSYGQRPIFNWSGRGGTSRIRKARRSERRPEFSAARLVNEDQS